MKSENRSLTALSGVGLILGFLAYWGLAHYDGGAVAEAERAVTAPQRVAEGGSGADAPSPQDEIFKIFPEDQWVKVPRGLMEQGNGGLDYLLFVIEGGSEDQVSFLRAMMPDAGESTIKAIADLILRFSRDWVQVATASLRRGASDEWQVTLPQDQMARLRQDFDQGLARSVGPGYAHLAKVLTYKPMSILTVPSMRLTFKAESNSWFLTQRQGEKSMSHSISETRLVPNAPVRALLERAKSLR